MRGAGREAGHAAAAVEELQSRLRPLLDAGFTVDSALTPAQAHASLVAQRQTLAPDAVAAVLSVNGRATALSVVRSGAVLFAREFPWGAESDRAEGGGARSSGAVFALRVGSEVRRSLLRLQQTQRLEVARLLVCGDVPDIRTLTGPLVDELSIDVETLDVGDDLDLSRVPEPSEPFRSRLGAWRTALALATEPARFTASKSREARPEGDGVPLARRVVAAAAVGALVTAAGWGVLRYLSNEASARQNRLSRMIGALEPELERQDAERRKVVLATAREAAMHAFASQGPRLARVMEAIGNAAPAEVALAVVRVEPGVGSWRITLEGCAEGPDAPSAQATLNHFLKALETSPWLGRPVASPSLRARASDAVSPGQLPLPAGLPPRKSAMPSSVATQRPAPAGSADLEVTRDGRPYRIPFRRRSGNLEADRPAEAGGQQQPSPQPADASTPAAAAGSERLVRRPASVVDFTVRYEVAK